MTEIFARRDKAEIFGKRGDVRLCQLCNTERQMSKSHVPPKSCIESRLLKRHASPYFLGSSNSIFRMAFIILRYVVTVILILGAMIRN